MDKKLYLTENKDVYLEKEYYGISFCIDSEWVTESICREDIPYLSRGFGISIEVLEDFFDN